MRILVALAVLLAGTAAMAQDKTPLNAADSDPVRLGWMQGFPPAADKQVRWDNSSMWAFPKTRWSFSHWRELMPSTAVRRSGPISVFPRAERRDIDAITLVPLGATTPMTWEQSLAANYTDGIVVLHKGRIVYERYFGALKPDGLHIAFSVTKSFVGTLAEILIAEGKLDPQRTMASYVPELAGSGFGDATVRQVMDMRTGIAFDEAYGGIDGDVFRMSLAMGGVPRPKDYAGPDGIFANVASLKKAGAHGGDWVYRTPNTDALAWVLEQVAGQSIAAQIEARFWSKLGMEQDASLQVDPVGTGFTGGGFSPALRDMARFGEMLRLGGRWQGAEIIPAAAMAAIRKGGDAPAFVAAKYPGLAGGSYASQWWHRAGGQFMAVGIHGQGIYIDPKAEMVIARFGSHPVATNRVINVTTLPAYDALAAHLSGR
ncbi:6-aminohexanoate-dimer hydrolase [Polymorphobacter glacialis]|uniref:6-aminohexanoate-dimer hydrolase n=1 Tax=Sandarakinorhabdus glacialis TaxID=1614636 RepID=A0A917EB95_9SPHN|nr:serine hydrolase [Polymorphobacter glacialis]GGE19652.1 6-aminohexanoate-dimer hydrolase [Polymorphobacter glacialis]